MSSAPALNDVERFARSEVEQSLATRFEAQVRRWPSRPAICAGERSTT